MLYESLSNITHDHSATTIATDHRDSHCDNPNMASTHVHSSEAWDSHAGKWQSSVQRITLAPCTALLDQTSSILPLSSPNARILDDGAGSGQLTGIVKSRYPNLPIVASDISKDMLATLDETAQRESWENTRTIVQDAQNLKDLEDGSFSHVLCTFVISFTADPQKSICEMHRVLHPGGVVGLATWSKISWVPIWEAAVHQVQGSTDYRAPDLFHPDTLSVADVKKAMETAGFKDINVEPFECFHPEKTVDGAVDEFYGMGNPSIKLLMRVFDYDFIEQTKPHFRAAYDRCYEGGKKGQFEVAILAVGMK